jgi:hypothetical protein
MSTPQRLVAGGGELIHERAGAAADIEDLQRAMARIAQADTVLRHSADADKPPISLF